MTARHFPSLGPSLARLGLATAACALLLGLSPASAGTTIGPAIRVNAEVVTSYELDQRIRLMTVLNQPGDIPAQARQSLIDDRLRHAAAKSMGVSIPDAAVAQGMTDFAARGNLSLDQLLQLLAQNGVDGVALRDFVRAGLEWRGAVRARFAGKVAVNEAEIDRAISAGVAAGGELQVLLSEIFLPDATDHGDPALLAQRILDGSRTLNSFQIYAQKYSKAPTAAAGGQLDWQSLSALPPGVSGAIAALKVGEVTQPLPVEGGIALYYLRDESEGPGTGPLSYNIEYARLALPPGQEPALQALAGKATRCGDLYPAGRGLPEEALQIQTVAEASLPGDLAPLFAGMDPGEIRLRTTANAAELVMLCSRTPQTKVPPSRDAVKSQLLNRKLAILAEGWLEQMRSDAIITGN